MKRNRFSMIILACALCFAAKGSAAQSTQAQAQSLTPDSTVSSPTPETSAPRQLTRDDVARELKDFQANGGPERMREIYKGGS